jgi:hypothetical protein
MNIQKIKVTRKESEFFGVSFDATQLGSGWSAYHDGHPTMERFKDSFFNSIKHPFMFFSDWEVTRVF